MEFVGWIANMLFFSGGLFKNPRHTMANYLVADILYTIMYFLMGLYTAAFSMSVTCVRILLAFFLSDHLNKVSAIISTIIAAIIVLATLQSPYDILIFSAAIVLGFSTLYRDDFLKYRLCLSLSQILWIAHSLVFGVYSMVFCCAIILATNVFALAKYDNPVRDWVLGLFQPKPAPAFAVVSTKI